jgi:hypothetical protein
MTGNDDFAIRGKYLHDCKLSKYLAAPCSNRKHPQNELIELLFSFADKTLI